MQVSECQFVEADTKILLVIPQSAESADKKPRTG